MLRYFMSRRAPKKLCLVADRSSTIRQAAASILEDLRFEVCEAECSDEVMNKCQQQVPDALLIDGAMASHDDFGFLQEVIERGGASQSKIILCTNDRNPSQIATAISVGAHEYMIKPFDRSILTAKFEKLGLTA